MISKIQSSAVLGVDAYLVEVEVDISQGLPNFMTVGLAEGALTQSQYAMMLSIVVVTTLLAPLALRPLVNWAESESSS